MKSNRGALWCFGKPRRLRRSVACAASVEGDSQLETNGLLLTAILLRAYTGSCERWLISYILYPIQLGWTCRTRGTMRGRLDNSSTFLNRVFGIIC